MPMLSSFLKEVGKPACRLLIFCFAQPFSVSKENIKRANYTRVREYKLLLSGKWNRVLREHFRGNTKESFVGSVLMYSRMGKKDNVVVKIKRSQQNGNVCRLIVSKSVLIKHVSRSRFSKTDTTSFTQNVQRSLLFFF